MTKLVTYNSIMSCKQLYEFQKIEIPINYEDTVINFVNEYRYKIEDIRWIIINLNLFTIEQYKLYLLALVKTIQPLIKNHRSIKAIEICEIYLLGDLNKNEIKNFYEDAKSAASEAYKYYNDCHNIYIQVVIANANEHSQGKYAYKCFIALIYYNVINFVHKVIYNIIYENNFNTSDYIEIIHIIDLFYDKNKQIDLIVKILENIND